MGQTKWVMVIALSGNCCKRMKTFCCIFYAIKPIVSHIFLFSSCRVLNELLLRCPKWFQWPWCLHCSVHWNGFLTALTDNNNCKQQDIYLSIDASDPLDTIFWYEMIIQEKRPSAGRNELKEMKKSVWFIGSHQVNQLKNRNKSIKEKHSHERSKRSNSQISILITVVCALDITKHSAILWSV